MLNMLYMLLKPIGMDGKSENLPRSQNKGKGQLGAK